MIISTREIGLIIQKRRIELGLSQEDLAERVGVTYQQIQRYEYGKTNLKMDKLQAIARALAVPTAHFFSKESSETVGKLVLPMDETERRIVQQFRMIKNYKVRTLVINLIKYASEGAGK